MMIVTTTWKHNFTNYANLENINESGKQHLEIMQPLSTKKIRLELNNLYDELPLQITSIVIYSDSKTKYSVTLDGKKQFSIEPHLVEYSDWIDVDLPANNFLSIDIISPNKTIHSAGLTISNDLVKTKDQTAGVSKYFFGVSGIQVQTQKVQKRIAFFGDSLTNQGNFSAPLALELEIKFHIMTANYGISGNRLLHPGHSTSQWSTSFGEAGLTRFDHMLIDYRPNLVIFMEGVNDLLHPGTGAPENELPTASAIIKAIHLLKQKCKQFNITFVPMTITPALGNINGNVQGFNDQKETIRLEVNQELMKMPHIIDLANLVGENGRLKKEFDSGDHVHFSSNGGQKVSEYIKEQLIRKRMI